MRIKSVTEDSVLFDNGSFISYSYRQCCCEENLADFKNLDPQALDYDFRGPLKFEPVAGYGFRFGDSRRMFFVPCYSVQNGYYSNEINIEYYDGKELHDILTTEGEICYSKP